MINLLPEEEKKQFKKAYCLRFFAIALWGVFAVLIVAIPTFAPVYFSVSAKRDGFLRESKSAAAIFRKTKEGDMDQIVKNTNADIGLLASGANEIPVGEFFSRILTMKPTDVYVSELSFIGATPSRVVNARNKTEPAFITITGTSATRSSLLAFVNNLKRDSSFLSVDLPISNLVNEINPSYSITIFVKTETAK